MVSGELGALGVGNAWLQKIAEPTAMTGAIDGVDIKFIEGNTNYIIGSDGKMYTWGAVVKRDESIPEDQRVWERIFVRSHRNNYMDAIVMQDGVVYTRAMKVRDSDGNNREDFPLGYPIWDILPDINPVIYTPKLLENLQGEPFTVAAMATPNMAQFSDPSTTSAVAVLADNGKLYGWGYGMRYACSGAELNIMDMP